MEASTSGSRILNKLVFNGRAVLSYMIGIQNVILWIHMSKRHIIIHPKTLIDAGDNKGLFRSDPVSQGDITNNTSNLKDKVGV